MTIHFHLWQLAEIVCCCFWRDSPQWARASTFTKFLHTTYHSR